ncbi:MAG: tryptophan 7-halogenase [Marinagarivorans sp.]|nr:tryptophan 7-halogenase [Marinagarivorans sp.]
MYRCVTSAESLFRSNLQGRLVTEPRFLHFVTGERKKLWNKNCIAVGLASGFLEPLESTSIHLAMQSISKFVEMFPSNINDCLATQDEYNRIMNAEYMSVRDFIILHYCTTERKDTEFWRACGQMEIPESLTTRLNLFRSQGRLYKDDFDLFTNNSWYAVLEGYGCSPLEVTILSLIYRTPLKSVGLCQGRLKLCVLLQNYCLIMLHFWILTALLKNKSW